MTASQLDVALDRPMPQSPDAERAVLGSIIINNHAFYRVIPIVKPPDFFKDAHRVIFEVMCDMAERGEAIETLTLRENLIKRGQLEACGGVAYLSALTDVVPDVANVERYAFIVKEKSQLRRAIVLGNATMRAALDVGADPAEVLANAEATLYSIAENSGEQSFVPLQLIVRRNMESIEAQHGSGRLITGIPTGYDRFNEMTSGFQPGDLIILAARPSVGKTAFALNIAEALAVPRPDGSPRAGERLYNVGFFSLEMSKEQIGLRLLSSESGVPNHVIRAGMCSERNWRDLAAAASRLAKANIFIDDMAGVDPLTMRAKARRLQHEAQLDMVIVDYLQLMTVKGRQESRQQEVSVISRSLKAIAKELRIPMISLSQLSRRSEQRSDHRPQLSDLRESGSIEQDADVVCFIHREEMYDKETAEKGVAEIIIAKQRNGPIGDFKLVFKSELTAFCNFEPQPEYLPA